MHDAILRFAEGMEQQLVANQAEKGDSWKTDAVDSLVEHLYEEVTELDDAAYALMTEESGVLSDADTKAIRNEAFDVANLALFIAIRAGELEA